eukprot:2746782-Rhodomonas_salina.2
MDSSISRGKPELKCCARHASSSARHRPPSASRLRARAVRTAACAGGGCDGGGNDADRDRGIERKSVGEEDKTGVREQMTTGGQVRRRTCAVPAGRHSSTGPPTFQPPSESSTHLLEQ